MSGFEGHGRALKTKSVPGRDHQPTCRRRSVTRPDQAALYRLSGDYNPIHIDPESATKAGLRGPILHGLATFGFAARHVVAEVSPGDPHRLMRIQGRFVSPAYPDDTLETEMWIAPARTAAAGMARGLETTDVVDSPDASNSFGWKDVGVVVVQFRTWALPRGVMVLDRGRAALRGPADQSTPDLRAKL